MWTFILLHIFGLSMCQKAAEKALGNSTQMYYSKLKIDVSVLANISQILEPFESDAGVYVGDLQVTTDCRNVTAGRNCSCAAAHRWSDDVCQSLRCCGDARCLLQPDSQQACVQNTTVSITGSIRLAAEDHQGCLTDRTSSDYHDCSSKLLREMKEVYSTLRGFDSLAITGFKRGSVIADFTTTIVFELSPDDLLEKSKALSEKLSGSLELETKGVVRLHMPDNPVRYNDTVTLRCTSQQLLDALPAWSLQKQQGVFNITTGTIATVVRSAPGAATATKVTLTQATELWAGEYMCEYQRMIDSISVSHKARATMDVALLPHIDVATEPPFPRCEESSGVQFATAKCEIKKSSETYDVSWQGDGITKQSSHTSQHAVIYTAGKIFSCSKSEDAGPGELWCKFTNRLGQEKNATVPFNVIYEGDPYCAAEGDWQDTKAGFTAVLRCENTAGVRRRKCSLEARWEEEVDSCVDPVLDNVLENAKIADTGLGSLDGNAGRVSFDLRNVTNRTETINSYANVNVSIQVLSTLGQKLQSINDESTTNDLLVSSSNLLEMSLEKSWTTSVNEENSSLAERYLSSVEQLIDKANLTLGNKQRNVEVETCDPAEKLCSSSVFSVGVRLRTAGKGRVKTAGFKQLERYLPHRSGADEPNSIVVSATTTAENKERVEITLDFQLFRLRPRHVQMRCVSWDNSSRRWSERGCEWKGPLHEARCVCSHLSSFAILMSKYPLEVPHVKEISYVGLSVSVASLVLTLLIELLTWRHVVKTSTLYIRHTAQVNIAVCLLVADCCFLASSEPKDTPEVWCQTFVVLKHFCFLAMFFWMLSLSLTLLHQAVFLFHQISKKVYLRFSFILGYGCPLLIVFISFLCNKNGAEGVYFSKDTCWLVYTGLMQGSIHTFLVPVGVILFVNVFCMFVVIVKLLDHFSFEKSYQKEKSAAKTVARSVIVLTPIFGLTWMIGFAGMAVDLTYGTIAYVVNYAFVLLNAFQGLFILFTTCFGDQLSRDAMLSYFKRQGSVSDPVSTVSAQLK